MSVREGLLSLLEEGPSYGFQLKTRFEAATGGTWPLNVGQVYTTLDRLERDGLVTMDESDGQKLYRLTDAGRDELQTWWEEVPGDDPPPRDVLLIKLLLALPFGRDHALDVLSRQRTALVQVLQARRRAAAESASDPAHAFAAGLVADAVMMRTEADLRWLDRCEARIAAATAAELLGTPPDAGPGTDPHPSADPSAPRSTSRRTRAARTRRNRT
ncbi:PadR family transcriptional regulator [Actinomarinicola tropica]|uniref:PadR family transcriptional regulator n=1 Tax=Actinomarinicola tropica TaxID=2789776 RepID=A0A5Q2RIT9_9ACTN|nr:PadR family transcriptional regulator [Actinomarinicola tropica]QGG93750.1 PadR family transcriptional regulator [Actinomarinicola tropica]